MSQTAIVWPMLGMVGLTFVVWLRMYLVRVGEMRTRRIHPQAVATSRKRAEMLENTTAADNFTNLFELPVLFHVLCLALLATQSSNDLFVYGAWLFVLLRAVHSFIHCTYNRVWHRFYAYLVSSVVLFGLWAAFAVRMLVT